MKFKIFAMILALTVVSWAQTATQTPAPPQGSTAPAEKARTSCCDKMATKDAASCQRHAKGEMKAGSCCAGKDSSCCGSRDAMSCMKDKTANGSGCKEDCMKDQTSAACCGGKSGKGCGKTCCSADKKDKSAKTCCEKELHS